MVNCADMASRHILLQLGYTSRRRLEGIARFAREHDWHITLEDRSSLPRGWTGDGVLTLLRANRPNLLAYARSLRRAGVPLVDFAVCHPEFKVPRVVGDHAAIGALAARHFEERNFRHVAWFSMDFTHTEALRLGGFRDNWSGEAPATFIWHHEVDAARYDDWNAMLDWLGKLLVAAPKPLAVFAYNDADAARLLNAALARGLAVPEEVAVLGVDDESIIVENQQVPLSSVRHDLERLGYEGAALLERMMDGERVPTSPILIPPTGITSRRSTDVIAVSSPQMRAAVRLIADHLADTYGTDQLAADLGLSRATLNRLFRAELGTTPSAEMLRQRLAKAKLLLASTEQPLKSIATVCGFCHAAHLANVFRAHVGLTPSAYRSAT